MSPPFNRKEKRPLRSTNEILLHSKFLFLEMSSSENYSVHIFSENDYLHCNIRSLLPTIIHEALKIDTSGQLRNLGIIREYSILISIFAYLFIFSNFIVLSILFQCHSSSFVLLPFPTLLLGYLLFFSNGGLTYFGKNKSRIWLLCFLREILKEKKK